jgi:hypothetical protein
MNTLGDGGSDGMAGAIVLREPQKPTTYISYYGDAALDAWVERLATRLRTQDGIDAQIDKWQAAPGDQEPEYLEKAIRDSTFVVLICTPEYAALFNGRQTRVGYAAAIITGQVLQFGTFQNYVPVLYSGQRDQAVPTFLSDSGAIDLRGDPWNADEYARLVKTLSRQIGSLQPGLSDEDRQRTYWHDLTWSDIAVRSAQRIRFARASLVERVRIVPARLEPVRPIESGLEGPWSQFLHQRTWKAECLEQIATLRETIGRLSRYKDAPALVEPLNELAAKLARRQPYPTLRAAFDAQLPRRLEQPWQLLRNVALRRRGGGDAATRLTLDEVRGRIARLLAFGERDAFRKCFLVMGGVGSGKSHFLAEVLKPFDDLTVDSPDTPTWLPIIVDRPRSGAALPDHLLAMVRATTRVDWSSLDTFWDVVVSQRPEAKIVFVLDDLHKWFDADPDVRDALGNAIESFSRIDNVHWLLCLNDRAYVDVAPLTDRIWAAYSDDNRNFFYGQRVHWRHPSAPRSGGWYRLDDVVEAKAVGVNIVREAGLLERAGAAPEGAAQAPDDSSWTTRATGEDLLRSIFGRAPAYDPSTQRALANPLVAAVYVVSSVMQGHSLDDVVNVRFLPFIEELRRLLVDRSVSEAGSDIRGRLPLEQAIDYVARVFTERGDAEIRAEELRERISVLAHNESVLAAAPAISAALQALERAHLLDLVERESPSGITQIAWHMLRFDLFWELFLADQQLRIIHQLRVNPDQAVQEIRGWLDAFKAVRLKNGVAQFLLLLSDAKRYAFAQILWSRALMESALPLHAALFAAGYATASRQAFVADALRRKSATPITPLDLLALVSFTRLAEPGVVSPPLRALLLQPHFGALAEYNLGDYAAFALSYAIAQVHDVPMMMELIQWLEGAEQLGAADDLARLCVDRLSDLLDQDIQRLTKATLDYARQPRVMLPDYEANRRKALGKGVDRYLFRHWFFDRVCDKIVNVLDQEPYWYFWKNGWYDATRLNVNRGTAIELEKFANFAISNRARSDPDRWDALVALVHKLVESNKPRHRHNAFFLIRHSEPVVAGVATVVDEQFHDDLRTIAADKRVAYLRTFIPGFLEANLGSRRPDPRRR